VIVSAAAIETATKSQFPGVTFAGKTAGIVVVPEYAVTCD
jgi:hypothetical protein